MADRKGNHFPKTHSLVNLVNLCSQTEPGFSKLQEHAVALTPMAAAFRYPGGAVDPDVEQVSRALVFAEEIYDFCERQLDNTTGQDNKTASR
jgi:HEPN domain-containing protein